MENLKEINIWLPVLDSDNSSDSELQIEIIKEKETNGNMGFDIGYEYTELFQTMFQQEFSEFANEFAKKIKRLIKSKHIEDWEKTGHSFKK